MSRARQLLELVNPLTKDDQYGSRVGAVETFNPADADSIIQKFKDGIQAPWKQVYKSTLGGIERTSIMIKLSMDPKDSWSNGILQNSRYAMFDYHVDGSLELFSGHGLPKFRKTRTKSADDALAKINKFLSSSEVSHES